MRYARQEVLDFIGKTGQERIRKATIAIVGLGGLGSVAAELLTRAGIGKLILIDNDFVDLNQIDAIFFGRT